ncbi:MmpS family transport accessory protein [Mycolicibacterium brumae]|uniref:MmpS family transport accessory protein n=1 Tax=Mycolicibacterium brumae TaxID=85968 RepID=UPI0023DE86A1
MLRRTWLPILIVVAVTAGGLAVFNLRKVFGAHPVIVTEITSDNAEDFNPTVVTYEVYGTGSLGVINYMDLDGVPQRAEDVPLPWTLTLSTTLPSVQPNIMASSDGDQINCRVTVDDEVKDERTATGLNAQTFCYVKAA